MTKADVKDGWHDDVDLDRLYARPGCIAASWAVMVLLLFVAVGGTAAAALIETTLATMP